MTKEIQSNMTTSPPKSSRSLFLTLIACFVGFLVYLSQIYFEGLVFKPIWPTAPRITLGKSVNSDPFIVPFNVINDSVIFPVQIHEFVCQFGASYKNNILADNMKLILSLIHI